jgi:predicted DNA-binding protein
MKEVKLAPRLRSVRDIGTHEVTASQLATNGMEGRATYLSDHIGRTVAVRLRDTIIAGPLEAVTDSLISPLLVLRIGQFEVAVHPAHPLTVAPDGHRLTVVSGPAH